MKEGWTYKKLGDIATEMFRGSGIKRDQITVEGTPCVRYGEIYTTYNISFSECFSHTNAEFISSPKYFSHGDLLFAITGESVEDIGKTIAYLGHERCLLGGDIVCMKHNQNPKYLSYALSSSEAIRQKGIGKTKLKVVHTNIPALSEIRIPIPSLSEQQRIVSRLDAAFSHIDELKANAEKQLSEARALFQKSLAKAMEPKEGWEEKTLKEICSVITDGTHHSPTNLPTGKYKYITAKNIKPWGLDLSNITYVSEDVHREIIARCNPQKGDVLYIKDGATTGIAIINPLDEEISILSSVALIRPQKNILLSKYLCYALNSPSIYEQTRNQMDGAAITRVTLVKIKGFSIPLPSLSEQQRIVERLDALSAHVHELEENQKKIISECDALKQALLRKVFE